MKDSMKVGERCTFLVEIRRPRGVVVEVGETGTIEGSGNKCFNIHVDAARGRRGRYVTRVPRTCVLTELDRFLAQVSVFENGSAPPGWCEVQGNDSTDLEGVEAIDDEAALVLAVERGGMPGCAFWYECGSGLMVSVCSDIKLASLERPVFDVSGEGMFWIGIIPAEAARRAHLITDARARRETTRARAEVAERRAAGAL